MLKVDDTKVLTIDDKTVAVDELDDNIKALVSYYDHWKQHEADARAELLKVQTAMRGLANEIAKLVMEKKEEGEEGTGDGEVKAEEVKADE